MFKRDLAFPVPRLRRALICLSVRPVTSLVPFMALTNWVVSLIGNQRNLHLHFTDDVLYETKVILFYLS